MKKSFIALAILPPVLYILCIFFTLCADVENQVLFTVLACYILLSILSCVVYNIHSKMTDIKSLCVGNLCIIVSNLILFIIELAWLIVENIQAHKEALNGAMEGGLIIFLLIILFLPHWISYLIWRITAALHCYRALCFAHSRKNAGIFAILHLFPVLDLIFAIVTHQRVNAFLRCQQPPIEME